MNTVEKVFCLLMLIPVIYFVIMFTILMVKTNDRKPND